MTLIQLLGTTDHRRAAMNKDYTADGDSVQLTRFASGQSGHRYQITTVDGFCTLSTTELLRLTVAGAKALNDEFSTGNKLVTFSGGGPDE